MMTLPPLEDDPAWELFRELSLESADPYTFRIMLGTPKDAQYMVGLFMDHFLVGPAGHKYTLSARRTNSQAEEDAIAAERRIVDPGPPQARQGKAYVYQANGDDGGKYICEQCFSIGISAAACSTKWSSDEEGNRGIYCECHDYLFCNKPCRDAHIAATPAEIPHAWMRDYITARSNADGQKLMLLRTQQACRFEDRCPPGASEGDTARKMAEDHFKGPLARGMAAKTAGVLWFYNKKKREARTGSGGSNTGETASYGRAPLVVLKAARALDRYVAQEVQDQIALLMPDDPDRSFKAYQLKVAVILQVRKNRDLEIGYTATQTKARHKSHLRTVTKLAIGLELIPERTTRGPMTQPRTGQTQIGKKNANLRLKRLKVTGQLSAWFA